MEGIQGRIIASTPLRDTSRSKHSEDDQHNDAKAIKDEAKRKKTVLSQVCEAIEAVGIQRKGASIQAIKKYILSKNLESDHTALNRLIKKALLKGIESGALERPSESKNARGAQGSFILTKSVIKPKVVKKPKNGVKKPVPRKQQESDSETKVKPKKQNLPDTAVKDLEVAQLKVSKGKPPKPAGKTSVPEKKNSKAKGTKTTNKNILEKVQVKETEVKERRDVSDSEVVIKKKIRKSLKSYSSDTELGTIVANKASKPKKKTEAKKDAAKKEQQLEQSPKSTKTKGTRKLFSANEEGNPGKKAGKTRAKKLGL